MIDLHHRRKRILLVGLITIVALTLAACVPAAQSPPTPSPALPTPTPTPAAVMPEATPTPQTSTDTPTPAMPKEMPTAPVTPGTPTPQPPIVPTPAPGQASCPNLENRLYRLTVAEDPANYAVANRLYYADGRVRAIVELQNPEANLPTGYAITVEGKQGALIQALVPVRDLCRLSNEPQVRHVRAPAEPVR